MNETAIVANLVVLLMFFVGVVADRIHRDRSYSGVGSKDNAHRGNLIAY